MGHNATLESDDMATTDRTHSIVIGIPHASIEVPSKLRPQFESHVDASFLRSQSDVYTDQVYKLSTVRWVAARWHRFVADPNRDPDDRRDLGVIPRLGFDGRSLYRPGVTHSPKEIQSRLDEFHEPYQVELSAALEGVNVFIDGHSMAAVGPTSSFDRSRPRPAACVGNCGDALGNALPGDLITCAPDDLIFAGQSLNFHLDRQFNASLTVGINEPFRGGYGVRRHSPPGSGRVGIQLELNQGLWWSEEAGLNQDGLDRVRQALIGWTDDLAAHCWKQ